ncbi:MAG TPA: agmatinase [Anaeromyxobacter sp.]|nr:agmatinase [Anaeromyxobacter sp.]
MPQDDALTYLRHGQAPFFRLPVAVAAPPPGTHAVLLGVPTDLGTTYQPGARLAPWHVRRVSALVQPWHPVHRLDVFAEVPAVDGGNAAFPPFSAAAMREAVEARVEEVIAAGAVPFLLGGDHSVSLPALRAVARRRGPLALVHLDAHLDTSGPETWGEAFHHGTPFRHAIDEGLVARGALFHVGIRGPWSSAAEAEPSARHGGRIYAVEELEERGVAAIGAEIRRAVGSRPTYVTFDVDALDPAYAPGTGTPVPGGLTTREALALLRALAGAPLAGMDVVEVSPALDQGDRTSTLAAHLLFEGLALLAAAGRG